MRVGSSQAHSDWWVHAGWNNLPKGTMVEHFKAAVPKPLAIGSKESWAPTDHVAVCILEDGRYTVGWSRLHPADKGRYNRRQGYHRSVSQAVGRMVKRIAHPFEQFALPVLAKWDETIDGIPKRLRVLRMLDECYGWRHPLLEEWDVREKEIEAEERGGDRV